MTTPRPLSLLPPLRSPPTPRHLSSQWARHRSHCMCLPQGNHACPSRATKRSDLISPILRLTSALQQGTMTCFFHSNQRASQQVWKHQWLHEEGPTEQACSASWFARTTACRVYETFAHGGFSALPMTTMLPTLAILGSAGR